MIIQIVQDKQYNFEVKKKISWIRYIDTEIINEKIVSKGLTEIPIRQKHPQRQTIWTAIIKYAIIISHYGKLNITENDKKNENNQKRAQQRDHPQ